MQSMLQEWKIYDKLYDDVTTMTVRFQYSLEHSKPVVLSLEALKCQVQNLQVNQPDLDTAQCQPEIPRGSSHSKGHSGFVLLTEKHIAAC